jgi:hypothetical protein
VRPIAAIAAVLAVVAVVVGVVVWADDEGDGDRRDRDARLVRNYCRYKHAPQALPFVIQRCIRTTTAAEIARRYDAGDKAAQHVIDNAAAY